LLQAHHAAQAVIADLFREQNSYVASIAGDFMEICSYSRSMSSRSFRVGRSVTGLGLFATKPIKRGVYIATYRGRRITTEEADRREARGARYQFDHRRLAAMERGALHQSFLPAEYKTSGTQGQDRDRSTAPNRGGRRNHLRLWAGVCEVFFGKRRLPLRSMPKKESSLSPESAPPPQMVDQISWRSANRNSAVAS